MLQKLSIKNLAIIEKAEINFTRGFCVLTGETGAGKSILVGGLNAVTGGKVTKDAVRNGAEKAEISAVFYIENTNYLFWKLAEYELPKQKTTSDPENGNQLVIMREIFANGKSTARINGKLTTVAVLRKIATELVDIHGQKDSNLIVQPEKQLEFLDSYAQTEKEIIEYNKVFREFSVIASQIRTFKKNDEIKNAKIEILKEKVKDVKKYKIFLGEEDSLNTKLKTLRNSESIISVLNEVVIALGGGSESLGVADIVSTTKNSLASIVNYIPEAKELSERLASAAIELKDIKDVSSELLRSTGDISELPQIETRVNEFLKLRRKYGLTADELYYELEKWENELLELENFDAILAELKEKKSQVGTKLKKQALLLTEKRKIAGEDLAKKLENELMELNIPLAKVFFSVKEGKFTSTGADEVEILFSANSKNLSDLKPLSKIASGGELSRVMLAFKVIASHNLKNDSASEKADSVQVFDEVDVGISGYAALKVGLKLKEASIMRQVICITHLAQVASKANTHYLIKKNTDDEKTFTEIIPLDFEGRKREIARIMSGNSESEISLKNAEELMSES